MQYNIRNLVSSRYFSADQSTLSREFLSMPASPKWDKDGLRPVIIRILLSRPDEIIKAFYKDGTVALQSYFDWGRRLEDGSWIDVVGPQNLQRRNSTILVADYLLRQKAWSTSPAEVIGRVETFMVANRKTLPNDLRSLGEKEALKAYEAFLAQKDAASAATAVSTQEK